MAINPALCIDFGGSQIKLALFDGASEFASGSLPNTGAMSDLSATYEAAIRLSRALPSHVGAIGAVAIAMPGVVDRARGTLIAAYDKYTYAIGVDMRAWATERFGVPAAIENDARAALLGEVTYGCAVGSSDAVLVTLGTGIGTAAMMNGTLLRGTHDHAGILGGHITVDLGGPPCNCGNIGCAEAVASTWALERAVRTHPLFATSSWPARIAAGSIGIVDLVESSQADAVSRDVLDRFIHAWGAAVIGLCHAYDPDVVVVSGGVMRSADRILPALSAYVGAHLWSSSHRPRLCTSNTPEHSVLLGLSARAEQVSPRKDHQ
jgi:glucokinase